MPVAMLFPWSRAWLLNTWPQLCLLFLHKGRDRETGSLYHSWGTQSPGNHRRFGTGFSGAFRDPEVRLESQTEISAGWTLLHGFGDRFWLCGAFTNTATKDTTYNSQCPPSPTHTPSTLGLSKRPEAAGTDLERH